MTSGGQVFHWTTTVGGSPTTTPAFSPGHTLGPPTTAHGGHCRTLVDATPTQTYRQPQPIVLIDPCILHDRMSTIDLTAITTTRQGSSVSPGASSCASSCSTSSSVGGEYYSDKVGDTWAHDVSERPFLSSSSSLESLPRKMAETLSTAEYTLSSNPPNPKTSFRLGDWICPSSNCAAHNFGRNLSCIGCGCPRSSNLLPASQVILNASVSRPTVSSPRFISGPTNPTTFYSSGPSPHQHHPIHHQQQQPPHIGCVGYPNPPSSPFVPSSSPSPTTLPHAAASIQQHKPPHPLLTPSGRAFAVGGKVQNVSTDPLNPCIMYWPDNEAFPEQGQIRPSGLVGVPQPPILNTGNRGPIAHQPGDWICQKCNYLNWRRRKVCQTCLPYAEGNGDSISAAVQSERIALLTSVLTQTRIDTNGISPFPAHLQASQQVSRSHSITPPQLYEQRRSSTIDISTPSHPHFNISSHGHSTNKPVHRSRSHLALGQQYSASSHHPISQHPPHPGYLTPSPIYQTPQPQRQPSPLLYSTGPDILSRRPASSLTAGNGSALGILNNSNGGFNAQQQQRGFDIANAELLCDFVQAQAAPAPLLPSFLQDMVQSPALSPSSTTTSSIELSSAEENDELVSPTSSPKHLIPFPSKGAHPEVASLKGVRGPVLPRSRGGSGSSSSASGSSLMGDNIANIWRLNHEETKSLTTGLPHRSAPLSVPLTLPLPVGAERKKARSGL